MANLDFIKKQLQSSTQVDAKADKPKAQLWANIGYSVTVETSAGPETRFISLPYGLPIDTMETVATTSSNEIFSAMQAAKNDLLSQVIAAGMAMKSGESKILNLAIELRRVNDPAPVIASNENPFVKALSL